MNARYFVDTNVFIYLLDRSAAQKSERARELIGRLLAEQSGFISAQVAHEFFAVALKKFKTVMTIPDAQAFLRTVFLGMNFVADSLGITERALALCKEHGFPWFDALLVAAATEAGCSVLYSEDFQHGQRIDGVQILNPFL